jgi:hypothetical protein
MGISSSSNQRSADTHSLPGTFASPKRRRRRLWMATATLPPTPISAPTWMGLAWFPFSSLITFKLLIVLYFYISNKLSFNSFSTTIKKSLKK